MRKLAMVALAVMLICSTAFAEDLDFSSMDLDELLAIHARLDAAIGDELECLLDRNNIYQGVYYVGRDIAPGRYMFTCIDDCRGDENFDFFYEIYESEETFAAYDRQMFDRFNCGTSAMINLVDGMVFSIVHGTAKVQIMEKPIWAP